MEGWTLVFSAANSYEAELVRGLLEEHDIIAVVMDSGSRMHPPLADAGVYVGPNDVVRALYLVRQAPNA